MEKSGGFDARSLRYDHYSVIWYLNPVDDGLAAY